MANEETTPPVRPGWEAGRYDASFAFVSDFGRGVVDLLDPQPGERVLDLGCGTGQLAAEIAGRGAEVTGIDADASMIEAARNRHPGIRFEQADGHAFAVDGRYDAVFSNAALHWMTRPEAVLERVAAALRPGGRFVGEFGAHGNVAGVRGALEAALEGVGRPYDFGRLWYFPTAGEYAALLERHGFEVRLLACFDRPTPLEPGEGALQAWIAMFAPAALDRLDEGTRERVLAAVEGATRAGLWRDGGWQVDYKRLRFVAVRP